MVKRMTFSPFSVTHTRTEKLIAKNQEPVKTLKSNNIKIQSQKQTLSPVSKSNFAVACSSNTDSQLNSKVFVLFTT